MITTSEIAPTSALAPFIRCYSYIEFDTKGLEFVRPTNASHEIAMTFQLKDRPKRVLSTAIVQSFTNTYGGVIGLFTQENGQMLFNGNYVFFEIMFKPNGFYKIFKLPPGEVNNQMIYGDDIFESSIRDFYEQLCTAHALDEKCSRANSFFLNYLKKQKTIVYKDSLTCISNLILKNKGLVNIEKLAFGANMSIRNFERNFLHQVGLSPKLFCNITRFNYALTHKIKNPDLDWTAVASDCGYYDQMHLIKDFKRFAGNTPSKVQNATHLSKVDFASTVDP